MELISESKLLFWQKMLVVLLMFPSCDVIFKITNKLKVNNDNFKFNGQNFKFNGNFKVISQLKKYQENTRKTPSIFLFWHILRIYKLFFISHGMICNLGQL
jgi:hypothetical protein